MGTTKISSKTVTIEESLEGTYYFKNAQHDKYMQIENSSSVTEKDVKFELWDFDGASDQRWTIDYVGDGYYKIISAGGYAVTASSLDTDMTQTTYTGSDTQQWKITKTGNVIYKFSPKSNSSAYMATDDGAFTSYGRDIQLKQNQSDYSDEWIIITNKDVSLIALPEDYDRTSFFDSALNNLSKIGYDNYYENSDYVNRGTTENELIARMANSKVTIIRTHGSQTSITTSDGSLTRNELLNYPSNILGNSELIIYGACLTGSGRAGAENLVNATYEQGSDVAIGFEKSVWNTEVNKWCDAFINAISSGKNVLQACYEADDYINKLLNSHRKEETP